MKYFVYISGLRGPEPQVWHGEQTRDQKPINVLAKHLMTDADNGVNLQGLAERYPYVVPETNS